MKNFKTHLEEAAGKGLTIFDIDETMFITKAKVHVVKNGKIVKKLDNQEFNTYKKKPGEEYDFGEFKNAEVFQKTSTSQALWAAALSPLWALRVCYPARRHRARVCYSPLGPRLSLDLAVALELERTRLSSTMSKVSVE